MREIAKQITTDPSPPMEAMTAFGLKFEPPDPAAIERLQIRIAQIGDSLGATAPELIFPDSGFLVTPLTLVEKARVTSKFDAKFSRYFVSVQDGLRKVPISEVGEKMVDMRLALRAAGAQADFSDVPITKFGGEWAGKSRVFWGRQGLVEKICKLTTAYNAAGLAPHFEDGFRPIGVQEGLFQGVLDQFMTKNALAQTPVTDDTDTILQQARSMVAIAPWIAGHKSGAAVDYTLQELEGAPLDIGHGYLQVGASLVAIKSPFVTFEQWAARQLFAQGAEMIGLSVYPGEDWHASVGDVIATIGNDDSLNTAATYGPIRSFDPQTGDIDPYEPADYYKTFNYSKSTP